MDEHKLATEATGAAIIVGAGWNVWRWFFPKKDRQEPDEPSLRITIRQMLCAMDKKLDDIIGRLHTHDTRFETLDRRDEELRAELERHLVAEEVLHDEQGRKLDCLIKQTGE